MSGGKDTRSDVEVAAGGEFALLDHVSLITGANSGIGLGIARSMLAAGARVAIWGRNEDRNQAAVDELDAGDRVAAWRCDVADEERVEACFASVLGHFGRVDSCFANAAGPGVDLPFVDLSLGDWRRTLETNLDGAFLTAREAARHMSARDGAGSIVFTSSLAAISGRAKGEAYAAAKGALNSLMMALAVELARHEIRTNSILPGWFETPMSSEFTGAAKSQEQVLRRIPARRWGEPSDLGPLAVFLAGPASSYVNGQTICVDGGYSVF